MAYALVFVPMRGKLFIESLIGLPLVLPPTAFGFYLLLLMGEQGSVGRLYKILFDTSLLFTFAGIAIAAAAILSFAHIMGEFGVILMVGGSIPHETRVVSIAIFEYVEAMRYQGASLFLHLRIRENVAFACDTPARVDGLLNLLGIGHLQNKKPSRISGGRVSFSQNVHRRRVDTVASATSLSQHA